MPNKKIFTKILIVLIVIAIIASIVYINKNKILGIMGEEKQVQSTTEAWDTSKVTAVTSLDGITVPVPKGYTASSVEEEMYVNGGLVIYEGEDEVNLDNWEEAKRGRNQWVWVPVPDVSRIYNEEDGVKKGKWWSYSFGKRVEVTSNECEEPLIVTKYDNEEIFSQFGLLGMTREKFYQEMQLEFEETIESIKTYGVFYIGRYETGDLSKKIPVIRRMNTDISNQTWYAIYKKIKYLGINNNLKVNMIWSCLWDETLQWFVDSGATNSTGKRITNELLYENSIDFGNYRTNELTYEAINGEILQTSAGTGTIIPTGSSEYTKINNIYDMAGNTTEWSLEGAPDNQRCMRGGCYGKYFTYSTVAYGKLGTDPNGSGIADEVGSRAYLYIK